MIWVSTGGYGGQPGWKTAREYLEAGIDRIELSGGLPDEEMLERLRGLSGRARFRLHNYFPPPGDPFVFNLASSDERVAGRSMELARRALRWCGELEAPVYSFHAGFLFDPGVEELGGAIRERALEGREEAMERFLRRVGRLAEEAGERGIRLLIENNVLTAGNRERFGGDPFLMTGAGECRHVMERTPDQVGLLVDVGHLKVTARTLGFDRGAFLEACGPWTRAWHLSDNDGTADSNGPVREDSWFWPWLPAEPDYCSLEVYGLDAAGLREQVNVTEKKLC